MIIFYKRYILDVLNWFYFRRVVNRNENTSEWKANNLRRNSIGEIYTVVRLRDEDLGDPDEIVTTRIMELTKQQNQYIASMDIQFEVGGLVDVDYYYIPEDPNAILVLWQPKIMILNTSTTLKFIFLNLFLLGLLGGLISLGVYLYG